MIEKEPTQEVYGFIITKPLQLMIVIALLEQLPAEVKKELLIVNYFADAEQVSIRLSKVISKECKVIFLINDRQAFELAGNRRYEKLFMDSDVGFMRNLTLIRLKVRSIRTVLAVYEEGLGTYRNDLYSGVKRNILSIAGCGVNFGGNWLVNELYLYKPDDYVVHIKAKIIKIKKSIQTLLSEDLVRMKIIFNAEHCLSSLEVATEGLKRCVIYLSNWDLSERVIQALKKHESLVVVKSHPNIKKIHKSCEAGCILVEPVIPAEMLIGWAVSRFESVSIYHHGSSAERYMNNSNCDFTKV